MSQHALRELAISDSGFVFDPRNGATYTLNATGVTVVLGLRDGMTVPAIIERIQTEFAEVPEDVDEHVRELLRALVELGVLPADTAVAEVA